MEQFDIATEQQLIALEDELADSQRQKSEGEKRYAAAFEKVYALFDKVVGKGKPARFITPKAMVIERRVSDPEPRIDPDRLKELVDDKLWTRITDAGPRVLNQDKLLRAVKSGALDPEVAAKALVKPEGQASKWYRPASKEDKEWLQLQAISERRQLESA